MIARIRLYLEKQNATPHEQALIGDARKAARPLTLR